MFCRSVSRQAEIRNDFILMIVYRLLATRFAFIPWVQMGTFNKEIGFSCELWGVPTIESTFDVANMAKTATVKDVPINNDALLNIQAC